MDTSALNTLDYAVIAVVLISTLFAFIRGFVGSFLSLTGWIVSIYLAYLLFPHAQPFLEEKTKNPLLVLMFGHSILLLGFLILFGIFNLVATTAVKGLTKGIIDRILGAGFGILRGGIIVSFVFFLITSSLAIFQGSNADTDTPVDDATPEWIKTAQTYPMLKQGKDVLKEFIPNSFYERIQVVYDTVSKKSLDERFVESTMKKLSKNLSKEQKAQLDKETGEDILNMSGEEAENKKLGELLKLYQDSDSADKPKISKQEVHRIENLLSKSQEAAKAAKQIEPVEIDEHSEVLP
jgi:membrane protein required for colicin V production